MGHLNSFSASGGENLNKNFPKIQMPGRGGVPWGGCLTFDLTGTLRILKQASPKWFYEKCAKIKAL